MNRISESHVWHTQFCTNLKIYRKYSILIIFCTNFFQTLNIFRGGVVCHYYARGVYALRICLTVNGDPRHVYIWGLYFSLTVYRWWKSILKRCKDIIHVYTYIRCMFIYSKILKNINDNYKSWFKEKTECIVSRHSLYSLHFISMLWLNKWFKKNETSYFYRITIVVAIKTQKTPTRSNEN